MRIEQSAVDGWVARMGRILALVLLAALIPAGLAGCSAEPADASGATVIDVRTPEEYADGHLEGAVNIDYQSGHFEAEIGELARDGKYVLYCRSGVRAGEALTVMTGLGFTDVTSAGGMEEASRATGLPVVG